VLAQHFIQRRRGDILSYLDENTPFPTREDAEETYKLTPEYKRLFDALCLTRAKPWPTRNTTRSFGSASDGGPCSPFSARLPAARLRPRPRCGAAPTPSG